MCIPTSSTQTASYLYIKSGMQNGFKPKSNSALVTFQHKLYFSHTYKKDFLTLCDQSQNLCRYLRKETNNIQMISDYEHTRD